MRTPFTPLSIWTTPARNRELGPGRQRLRRARRERDERFRAMTESLERFPYPFFVTAPAEDESEPAERVYLN
jgi:hypothetical protein